VPPVVSKALVSVGGSLNAQANIGVYAQAQYSQTYTKNLVTFPIPDAGISISNLVTVGVAVTLDAEADISVTAQGQVLVGAGVAINNFAATLDMVGTTSGVTGFNPVYTKTFNASGQIDASVGLGLPAELAVGIKIPSLSINKQVGLKNTPKVTAELKVQGSTNTSDTSDCNNGIAFSIGISDSFDLDLLGKTTNLVTLNKPNLFADCFQ